MPQSEATRFGIRDKDRTEREWKVCLLQPEYVTDALVLHARRVAQAKAKEDKLPQVKLIKTKPKKVIQTLHV